MAIKGFIKNYQQETILPITRAELVLDKDGKKAFTSKYFEAGRLNEDGSTNEYGLISAAERAMISGGSGGQGISDIYSKLDYINSGFYFNNNLVSFYEDKEATPIKVKSGEGIAISVSNNDVTFALATISDTQTSASGILKSITIDKYGRVTAVSGSALTNAELPQEIEGKTIKNASLSGCTTTVGTSNDSIVNKKYVDDQFNKVTGVATGALKFKGSLNTTSYSESWLTDSARWHTYYKVTEDIQVNKSDLFDQTGLGSATKVTIKAGDTLIIYPESDSVTRAKWVHIPSGDETITTITVKEDSTTKLGPVAGPVSLKFGAPFKVVHESDYGNQAHISLPAASASQSGYLSKDDYAKFSNYANNLSVSYTGNFDSGDGVYEIGTINIGGVDKIIYGRYNTSILSLTNGTSNEYNPILKFEETGAKDVKITVEGTQGVKVKKIDNKIQITAACEIDDSSKSYLETDGYKFAVKIGKTTAEGSTNGLTDYSEFDTFRTIVVNNGIIFTAISNSLNDTSKDIYYGSTDLKTAIYIDNI